jgi:hypothetical protein
MGMKELTTRKNSNNALKLTILYVILIAVILTLAWVVFPGWTAAIVGSLIAFVAVGLPGSIASVFLLVKSFRGREPAWVINVLLVVVNAFFGFMALSVLGYALGIVDEPW